MKIRRRAFLSPFILVAFMISMISFIPLKAGAADLQSPPRMPKGAINYITPDTEVTNIQGSSVWEDGVLHTVTPMGGEAQVSFDLTALESLDEYVISLWTYLPAGSVDWGDSVDIEFGHNLEKFKIMKNMVRYYRDFPPNGSGVAASLTRSVSGGGAPVGEYFKVDIHVWEDLPDRPGKNAFSIYINGEILKYSGESVSIGNRIADPPRLILSSTDDVKFSGIRIYKVDETAEEFEDEFDPNPTSTTTTSTTTTNTTTTNSTTTSTSPSSTTSHSESPSTGQTPLLAVLGVPGLSLGLIMLLQKKRKA